MILVVVDGAACGLCIGELHAYVVNGLTRWIDGSNRYWVDPSGAHVAGQSYSFRNRPMLRSHSAFAALSSVRTLYCYLQFALATASLILRIIWDV